MSTHTPTPLSVGSDRAGYFIRFCSAESAYSALRAVNAHEELLAALRKLAEEIKYQVETGNARCTPHVLAQARAAIAKAEGQS